MLLSSLYAFSKHTVLTAEGARTYEYLQGVKEFIRVADADRLRMLQSYSGAERRADGTADVIHVYEKLLPYAILFGMEDEWGDVLEKAYTTAQRGASWIGDPTSFALRAQLATFVASSHSGRDVFGRLFGHVVERRRVVRRRLLRGWRRRRVLRRTLSPSPATGRATRVGRRSSQISGGASEASRSARSTVDCTSAER